MKQSKRPALNSMTGFASIRGKVGERRFLLEAKSLNHRFCEVNVRMPGRYTAWDFEIQKEIRKRFQRGRIDVFLKEEGRQGVTTKDVAQLKQAHQQLKKIIRELHLSKELTVETVINFSQIYFRDGEVLDVTALWKKFRPLLARLLDRLETMRQREGAQLLRWFKARLPKMERLLGQMERMSAQLPGRSQKRLLKKIKELRLNESLAEERIATEAALLCEKSDVTEELVRLRSHMKEFKGTLKALGSIGRKIDFLMQEVGREVNTISSKSQDSRMSQYAVQFKSEIEKVREQAANVE